MYNDKRISNVPLIASTFDGGHELVSFAGLV